MIEGVLMQEMRLVEEKDGVGPFAAEVLHVSGDGVEDGGGRGRGGKPEGEAELAVEIASCEGGVVAVGETQALLRKAGSQRPQDTGLADSGLAREQHRFVLVERLGE